MAYADIYRRQVTLLLRLLPFVANEKCFALKGGTAINLFVRDLPRLSVDIDLTYLPIQSYEESLKAINAAMARIETGIKAGIPGSTTAVGGKEANTHLLVRADGVTNEIEVTPVLRGCVYESELKAVTEPVEDTFGFVEMQVLSFADLYAGKFVAALDRQNPRDFFDTKELLGNEGIDDSLRRCFLVYLVSASRPMHEILTARRRDMTSDYERGFKGMTEEPVTLEELNAARETFITQIVGNMPDNHRKFLVSFVRGTPDWTAIDLPEAANLPAVKFRQLNLDKLTKEKRDAEIAALEKVLAQ
ncbi:MULTISPECIES: nucleotidyl transferase AbiEii/AbiGii toxin family protein [unclassified Bradyrhizobium]|uniref:nucleotidyl transferase AbiEii/AbiGii toxin family protein n=1 Tax=unclassified Bradyrhizobium TaxID=2631580 RepID=UPI001FFA818B|nr:MULTISPECIES: nucleotidyl transferase AbiEii/AbiGii toxin family protein [unclassified Bradyrhizobium]MCK1481539.1 nucleotidyl transferase AbiEii/AbiGii toxin family protein [Bradyrhizobium sp. 193]MCK1656667.1 nucleotidyl transferase AbiEii/AbiGii toxin family protein [Bradyrhizobium sp. 151]